MSGRVAWIQIAPVKALGLQRLEAADLHREGLEGDRRFFLVDGERRLVNGKQVGPLVQVEPRYDHPTRTLALVFPDGRTVAGTIEAGEEVSAHFWTIDVPVRVVHGPWSGALSELAGIPLTLVERDRPAVDRGPSAVASILSTGSLGRLADELGVGRVDDRRFRMNVGVEGVEPHAEDGWIDRRVRVGEALVVPKGHVGRCAITTQDPDTGVPDLDTLKALASYRCELEATERLPFGVYALVAEPGRIRLGDPVELVPRA